MANSLAVSRFMKRLMEPMLLILKIAALHFVEICFSISKCWSNHTPRYLIWSDVATCSPATVMDFVWTLLEMFLLMKMAVSV